MNPLWAYVITGVILVIFFLMMTHLTHETEKPPPSSDEDGDYDEHDEEEPTVAVPRYFVTDRQLPLITALISATLDQNSYDLSESSDREAIVDDVFDTYDLFMDEMARRSETSPTP